VHALSTTLSCNSQVVIELQAMNTIFPLESIPWDRISLMSATHPKPMMEQHILLVDLTLSPLAEFSLFTHGVIQHLRAHGLFCEPLFYVNQPVPDQTRIWGVCRLTAASSTIPYFEPSASILQRLHNVWWNHTSLQTTSRSAAQQASLWTIQNHGIADTLSRLALFNLAQPMMEPFLRFIHGRQLRALANPGIQAITQAHRIAGPKAMGISKAKAKRAKRSVKKHKSGRLATEAMEDFVLQPHKSFDFKPKFPLAPSPWAAEPFRVSPGIGVKLTAAEAAACGSTTANIISSSESSDSSDASDSDKKPSRKRSKLASSDDE